MFLVKQARKGFRPPSAMKGIGYFQNLRNLLRNCLEIFWEFFRRIFLEEFLGEFFLGGFFERIFWKEFFKRNFLGGFFWKEGRILILRSATQAHRT